VLHVRHSFEFLDCCNRFYSIAFCPALAADSSAGLAKGNGLWSRALLAGFSCILPCLVYMYPGRPLLVLPGEKPELASLLSSINLSTARSGQVVQLGSNPEDTLTLELTPTPRWVGDQA
jgi:hypothetical protein